MVRALQPHWPVLRPRACARRLATLALCCATTQAASARSGPWLTAAAAAPAAQVPMPSANTATASEASLVNGVSIAASTALAAATLTLTVTLLQELGDSLSANVLFSPYSLMRVLGMLRLGASGRTAAQLAATLGEGADFVGWLDAFDAAGAALQAQGKRYPAHTQLWDAQALWAAPGVKKGPFWPSGLDDAWHTIDFADATGVARGSINRWVSERTGHQVHELLGPGMPARSTRLLLTCALFTSAPWARPFSQRRVHRAPFWGADGLPRCVPTMAGQIRGQLGRWGPWLLVDVPYRVPGLSLTFMWHEEGPLAPALAALDGNGLAQALATLAPATLEVRLPKFRLACNHAVEGALMAAGVVDAFTAGAAELGGIDAPPPPLHVDALVHHATLEVDERGTQAAAATGLALRPTRVVEALPVIRVERPFIFFMRDAAADTVLFAGRVAILGDAMAGPDGRCDERL